MSEPIEKRPAVRHLTCCPATCLPVSGVCPDCDSMLEPADGFWIPWSCVACRSIVWSIPTISGEFLFHMQETHGIPKDLTVDFMGRRLDAMRAATLAGMAACQVP